MPVVDSDRTRGGTVARADAGVVARERLPGRPASAGAARRVVRAALGRTAPPDLAETAELLVSEVVTNAVVHAATDIELVVNVLPDGRVRVEVSDGSRHAPARRDYLPTATTGRGLQLVEELADASGTLRSPTGKTVWFEVAAAASRPRSPIASVSTDDDGRPAESVPVRLLGVPLALYAAWHEQADAMLRDHLLATLDEGGAEEQVARHAACSAAMSLLLEHLPVSGTVPGSGSEADAVVPVPVEGVADFEVLDETLDRAIAKADLGELLAPASDKEVRELRRWVCREVRRQVAGEPPQAWADA